MKPEICVSVAGDLEDPFNLAAELLLPATDEEIDEIRRKLRITDGDCLFVEKYEFLTVPLDMQYSLKPDARLFDELNFLAGRFSRMSDYERALFEGVSKCRKTSDIEELINLTYDLQHPYLLPGVCSVRELGKHYIDSALDDIPAELKAYVCDEAAGQYALKKGGGAFTDAGYVVDTIIAFDPVYEGGEFPREDECYTCHFRLTLASQRDHRLLGDEAPTVVLKLPEPEAQDEAMELACMRLGVRSLDDCVVLDSKCHEPLLAGMMEGSRLSELYNFAATLYDMECYSPDFIRFFAALESYQLDKPDFETIKEAFRNTYDFGLHIDIHSAEDYGRHCLKEQFTQRECNLAVSVIDLHAYGEHMMRENNAVLTSHGMVIRPHNLAQGQTEAENTPSAPELPGMGL